MIPSADGIYYVDLSATWEFIDGSYQSVYPENCTADNMVRGVGNIAFQLSFSATDADGNAAVGPFVTSTGSWIGPYRNYWRLRYGDVVISSGVITSMHSKEGTDYVDIAGKTWEHFFERWQYPFDPRPTHVNDYAWPMWFNGNESTPSGGDTPPGLSYQAINRDTIQIWADLLATVMNTPPDVTLDVPHRVPMDMTDLLSGHSTVQPSLYQFTLGDDSDMLTVANGLADMGDGFDWWIGWDRAVHFGHPYRFGTVSAPFIFFTLDSSIIVENLEFTNNGPLQTHLLARGAGLATQTTFARAYGYPPAQTQWSRLDRSVDVGDIRNADQMTKAAQKELSLGLNPEHEVALAINPASIGEHDFWLNWRVGRAFYINRDLVFWHIDHPFQLLSWSASITNQGEAEVNFTLKQIYDYSINAGVPEG